MNFPIDYRLADDGLEVRLGPLRVRRIAYSDMETARAGYALWNEHWTNPWPWRFLIIRRRSGLFRNFVINPGDREPFLKELSLRIERARR
jgi:hypothetical protein